MARLASRFDYPFSSRFDEQYAFVIFDSVEVPRHRVFIDSNLPVYNTVMSASWRANAMHQTMIARAIERIGDNAVDIGEQVVFVVSGLFREFPTSTATAI